MANTPSHIDKNGQATMVDVSHKSHTVRTATATGRVDFPPEIFAALAAKDFLGKKGSIVQTSILAGIQGAKKTADLIPLCHSLTVTKIGLDIVPRENSLHISCSVKCTGPTGVEMEALTGASVAALTLYDMCKALSHDIRITAIQLEEKTGGKNDYTR